MIWLTSSPGTPLPARHERPAHGRWVVCGHDRYGTELSSDLRAEGLDVTEVHVAGGRVLSGEKDGASVVESGHVADAVAFVAATTNDTTNLWLVEAARRVNPDAFVVALQNRRANGPLYQAIGVDFGLVPAEVIAHETLARLANPVLMRFLPKVPQQGDEWASRLLDRLVKACDENAPDMWSVKLTVDAIPAVRTHLERGTLTLGDLLRDPGDRDQPLDIVPLMLLRDEERLMAPDEGVALRANDDLLLAGRLRARGALELTLSDPTTAVYVIDGRRMPSSWVWRRLSDADSWTGERP